MKFDVYEGGIRVPFFVKWPKGLIRPKRETDAPISVTDLLPTIAAATGAKVPANVDGVNIVPYLQGKTSKQPHKALFWRTTEHAALQRQRRQPKATVYIPHIAAVREGKWKMVVLDDAGPNEHIELYDLVRDPSEKNDLASKEEKVVKRLSGELAKWRSTLKPQVIPQNPIPKR